MIRTDHEEHGRSPFRFIRNLAIAVGCGLTAIAARGVALPAGAPPDAATPPAVKAPAASIPSIPHDVLLARAAMTALDADPRLKQVTLIVSVVDRVAVIGGPVPTEEHGKWAEERVRGIAGIADVKNRCFVQTTPDPLVRAVADRLGSNPQPTTPKLPPIMPGTKPAEPVGSAPTDTTIANAAKPANAVTALRPAIDTAGVLLPPIRANGPIAVNDSAPANKNPAPIQATKLPDPPPVPGTSNPLPTGVLTATPSVPVVDPSRPESVLAGANAIRRSDARFAGLTVELDRGVVVISGHAARASHAWDLSDAIRRVPGISRVVVGQVDVR